MTEGPHVVVVDDDSLIIQTLELQLQAICGGECVGFESPAQALSHIAGGAQVDLVISDLMIPGFDGIEFVRKLAELRSQVPIILISSADEKILRTAQTVAQERGLCVLGSIAKPVGREELATLIAKLNAESGRRIEVSRPEVTVEALANAIRTAGILQYVQPQVLVDGGKLAGVEVLSRWIDDELGFIPPDQFIALAEREDLIDELTLASMESVMDHWSAWQAAGIDLTVSINVSMQTLMSLDLPERIVKMLDSRGLPRNRFVVEVTESGLMNDPAAALDVVTRLRLKDIELSLDDYGTGYSSLLQLRRIPFQELKIDRSFVDAALTDPESAAIVRSAVSIARELGLRTVAEGVENEATMALLHGIQCDIAQGYFIARPMPIEDFPDWFRQPT